MGVANVKVEAQLTVVGALLIIAVILSDLAGRASPEAYETSVKEVMCLALDVRYQPPG